jgi:4-alpha-glucanotransferase
VKSATSTLYELAALSGIQASYAAADGSIRIADQDVILAMLRALGVLVVSTKDAQDALRARLMADAGRVLEPVVVVRTGRLSPVKVTLPQGVDLRQIRLSVDLEEGTELHNELAPALRLYSSFEADGRRYGRYCFEITRAGSDSLPAGYHRLCLEGEGITASALLVVAPPCPIAKRAWGAFMPLHALRSETDWGTGSYSDLAQLGRFVSGLGASMLGSLPLYPFFLDPPADPSPYRPVSRLAYNELYIDPTELPEIASSGPQQVLGTTEFSERITSLHASRLVEYSEVSRLRREVLEPMAANLFSGEMPRRLQELDAFARSHPELVAYARFRAARERTDADRARYKEASPDGGEDPAFGYHLYCQWAAATQLDAAGDVIPLYADLPVGVHPDGFDPYISPDSFVFGVSGGAPPDVFFRSGQNWGFPPLHSEAMRQDDYSHLRAVLGRAFRHAGYLRIDHVMGLQRLYAIPDGFDASHGAYLAYRPDELHALVSLEADRAGTVVVGEDLGTVPDEVRERMASDKMLRSWVFQFESKSKKPLPAPPADVLASLGTHDLPRFGTFLWGGDIDERQLSGQLSQAQAARQRVARETWRIALLKAVGAQPCTLDARELTATAYKGSLAHLAASAATLVLIDIEELLDERRPQNRPGTGPEADNWRCRAALSLSEIRTDRKVIEMLCQVDSLRQKEQASPPKVHK